MYRARSRLGRSPGRTRARQRGASAVLIAVLLFALLSALTAAVDVGRLYFAQRELQKAANLAALDAARAVGGCRGVAADPAGAANVAARASLAANESDASVLDHSLSAVELGVIESTGGVRRFVPSAADDAVAVNVVLVQRAPRRLLPLFSTGTGNLRAEAAALSAPMAAISVGSSLASLDTGDSALLGAVLGGLLGGEVSIDAAAYRGLASVRVTLRQLVAAATGDDDIRSFLRGEISVPAFLAAVAEAVDESNPALAGVVDDLAAAADPARSVTPGALFPVEEGLETPAGGLPVNAADLLLGIAMAGAQGTPVNLLVPVSLPGVANATLQLDVIEPPQFGGPGRPGFRSDGTPRVQARTAQVDSRLSLVLLPVGPLETSLQIEIEIAQATATLTDLRCATLGQPVHSATVDAVVNLATVTANLRIPLTGADVDAAVDTGSTGSELEFEGPFVPQIAAPSPENTQRVGSDPGEALAAALADVSGGLIANLPGAGAVLAPAQATLVSTVLNPVLLVLDDAVLSPTFAMLGLSFGAADVTVESLRVSQPDPFGGGDRPYVELITH